MKKLFIILALCAPQKSAAMLRRPTVHYAPLIVRASLKTIRPYSSAPRPPGPLQKCQEEEDRAFNAWHTLAKAEKFWKEVMGDCARNGCSNECKNIDSILRSCKDIHESCQRIEQQAYRNYAQCSKETRRVKEYMKR